MKARKREQRRVHHPTGSYSITLPSDVVADYDGRVASYWLPGDNALLQLSSYKRSEGPQICASERLRDRVAGEGIACGRPFAVDITDCPDVAAVEWEDEEGFAWVMCYLVWPHLAVLATISASDDEERNARTWWAFEALRGLTPR